MRARHFLFLVVFCIPFRALAQTPMQTSPDLATRGLAQGLVQQCEDTDELGKFSPVSCFVQHEAAGDQAARRRNWTNAIKEEDDAIAILLTYPQRIKFAVGNSAIVSNDGTPADINGIVVPYLIKTEVYEMTKQYDLAISNATAAIVLDPTTSIMWNSRCWNRALLGDLADALQDCRQALQLRPDDANILDSAGFVYLRLKNYPAAISNYRAALKINPKLASSLYGMGLAEQKLNNPAQGKQDIMDAEQIDPKIASDFGT